MDNAEGTGGTATTTQQPDPASAYSPDAAGVAHDAVDGEVLVIDERTGVYHSLRGTAATVWVALCSGRSLREVADTVAERHAMPTGATADTIRADIHHFVAQLLGAGLVAAATPTSGAIEPTPEPTPAWTPPLLESFTDLQDLLLYDPIHEVDQAGWPHVEG